MKQWSMIILYGLLPFFTQALFAADNCRPTLFGWPSLEQARPQTLFDPPKCSMFQHRSFSHNGISCNVQMHHSNQNPAQYKALLPTITSNEALGAHCANNALQHNMQLAHTKQYVDCELSSFLAVIQDGSVLERMNGLGRLEGLCTAYDGCCDSLNVQGVSMQGLHVNVPDTLQRDHTAAVHLSRELHKVVDSITVELFTKKGDFLDGTKHSFVNDMRLRGQNSNIENLVIASAFKLRIKMLN